MITAFLPCRAGSQRVPKKNILPIADYKLGLTEIKIKQLEQVSEVSEIILSTDDTVLLDQIPLYNFKKLKVVRREKELATSSVPTDELVSHASSVSSRDTIMWTHVTSPFFNSHHYSEVIRKYIQNTTEFDSLMTVHQLNDFIWKDGKPFNYDRSEIRWPATQSLDPLFIVDSCCFIASKSIYDKQRDRIGERPQFYKNNGLSGFDIDWPEDYEIAKAIIETNPDWVA